jgi:putative flippase GtrA
LGPSKPFADWDRSALSSSGLRREFLSFSVIGSIALVIDVAALWLALNLLGLGLYSGRFFSYLSAATCTWWLNRRFTFKGAGNDAALRQWIKFLAANALGGVINYSTYAAIVTWTPNRMPIALEPLLFALPYGATVAGSLAGLVFNFTTSKFLVFQQRNPMTSGDLRSDYDRKIDS